MRKHNKNQRPMRKKILFLAALFAIATSQLYSQENNGLLYRSDFRIGLTAGTNINLSRSVFLWPDVNCKLTEVQGSFKDRPAIVYGIYLGHEHDVGQSGKLRLGIDGSIGNAMEYWKVDFKNDTNASITSIKNTLTSIYINEGVYLSYLLTDRIAINGGIDFYEALILPNFMQISSVDKNGGTIESPLYAETMPDPSEDPKKIIKDAIELNFKVSARLKVGATYNINSLLFVSANAYYTVPVYLTLTDSEFKIAGDIYGMSQMGVVGKYRSYIQNLGIMFTFGFKL